MNTGLYYRNLTPPTGKIDVILDTDAYNEIDDQFAISYMIGHQEKFNIKAICAAPFYNKKASSPADGMEQSHQEIQKLLHLMEKDEPGFPVLRGSEGYLPSETEAVDSEAAAFMAKLALSYTPEHPLYIVAIGAITNVASAMLQNPFMRENCVVVWLGGRALHMPQGALEFNMKQDIAAARVVFNSGVPLIILPCRGVVDRFCTTKYELLHWLKGKNALCDYLCDNTIQHVEAYAGDGPWSKPIWDVTAVAWLLNEDERYMTDCLIPCPIPEYDLHYATDPTRHQICYVNWINRDTLFADLFRTLKKF